MTKKSLWKSCHIRPSH